VCFRALEEQGRKGPCLILGLERDSGISRLQVMWSSAYVHACICMHASVRPCVCVFIYLMCELQLEREFAPASSAVQSHTSPSSAPFRLTTAPFAADGHEQQQGRRKPGNDVLQL
jgi:hypothetical protein